MDAFEDFREGIRLTAIVVISAVASASLVIALGSRSHMVPSQQAGVDSALVDVSTLVGEAGR